MMPILYTARLRLQPYEAADLDDLAALYADRDVTAQTFLGYRDRSQAVALLEDYVAGLAERGWGMATIRDRDSNAYLGEVGLVPTWLGAPGLRYTLARAGWGKGIATEASIALIDDAFGRAGFDRMLAGVRADNTASVRIMEKLGFVWQSEVTDHGPPFGLFALTADDWAARPRG